MADHADQIDMSKNTSKYYDNNDKARRKFVWILELVHDTFVSLSTSSKTLAHNIVNKQYRVVGDKERSQAEATLKQDGSTICISANEPSTAFDHGQADAPYCT